MFNVNAAKRESSGRGSLTFLAGQRLPKLKACSDNVSRDKNALKMEMRASCIDVDVCVWGCFRLDDYR